MTQSAGGLHNSFQPIIQMGSAIQTRSLQLPLFCSGSLAEPSHAFCLSLQRATRHFACCLSSAVIPPPPPSLHDATEAQLIDLTRCHKSII